MFRLHSRYLLHTPRVFLRAYLVFGRMSEMAAHSLLVCILMLALVVCDDQVRHGRILSL